MNSKPLAERVATIEQSLLDMNHKIDDDRESRKEFWLSVKAHQEFTDKRLASIEQKIWMAAGGLAALELIFRLTIK